MPSWPSRGMRPAASVRLFSPGRRKLGWRGPRGRAPRPQWPDRRQLLEPQSPSSMTCPRTPCWTSPMRRPPVVAPHLQRREGRSIPGRRGTLKDSPDPGALGQKGTCGPCRSPSSVAAPIPLPRGDQGGWEEASQLAQEDMLSIAAYGEGASFSSDMQVGEPPAEEEPGIEVASEASAPQLSSSVSALMGCTAAFLKFPWMPAAPRLQKFPASCPACCCGLQGQALRSPRASSWPEPG
ncbi:UNVERIFIED_CONTAM: hypothetical protein FKN15_076907 [Acipenser sinensis]